MKKVLTTLVTFFALALTACGGTSNNGESKKSGADESSSAAPTTSTHTHTYDETRWESNDTQHWHPATCEHTSQKGSPANHTFGEPYDVVPAECGKAGSQKVKCSVCNKEVSQVLPALEHDWQRTDKAASTEEGFVKTEQYKCSKADHYALRFSATEMDEAASLEACGLEAKDTTIYAESNTSGSHAGSIRLRKAENDGGTKAKGTHIVYKVKLAAEAKNVDLEFQIDPKSGYDVPVFDYVDGDAQQGYIEKNDGELELTTKRYGLIVNGERVELGEDLHGNVNGGSKLWFNWNVKMDLQEGTNTIDIFCLGGYRAYIYNFQLTGVPANA